GNREHGGYQQGDYEQDYRREYERAPVTYYERRSTPNSNYEYRSSYSSSTTTYGGARYNAYSDRSRPEPRYEPRYEPRDAYRAYDGHDRYEAPREYEHRDDRAPARPGHGH
ncbi:hypothetical protein, partial [Phenylobacterium sp.]|uniref:hypothetical protein n=1 Tax=Phenylobacterium sp. TaxID=1871053 RepID=UPI00286BFA73